MAHHFVPNFTREMSKNKNKNHISQCKTAQNLGLSPSTIHNIVKRFRESREITAHVGQGRKPQLNVLDLWALRWHCIRNRHAAVLNIATWAQEHFRKPQSAAASRNATWISVTLGESYISILCSDAAGFSGPELISDSQKDNVKMCAVDFEFSVPKTKGTIQTFISNRSKSKRLSWYGGSAEQTAWVTGICAKVLLTWRHRLGLYRDINCHQDDVFHGKSMVIGSRQCQLSFCMCYNSVVS